LKSADSVLPRPCVAMALHILPRRAAARRVDLTRRNCGGTKRAVPSVIGLQVRVGRGRRRGRQRKSSSPTFPIEASSSQYSATWAKQNLHPSTSKIRSPRARGLLKPAVRKSNVHAYPIIVTLERLRLALRKRPGHAEYRFWACHLCVRVARERARHLILLVLTGGRFRDFPAKTSDCRQGRPDDNEVTQQRHARPRTRY
jgi:hypothetical protein